MAHAIDEGQRDEFALKHIRAVRRLYSRAKLWLGWQLTLSGPLAVALALATLYWPAARQASEQGWFVVWVLLLWMLEVIVFTPKHNSAREPAARLQEALDTHVLQLPWNAHHCGSTVDDETVSRESRDPTDKEREDAKRPWYSGMADLDAPVPVSRLSCQRANVMWDHRLRSSFCDLWMWLLLLSMAVILGIGLSQGWQLRDVLLKLVAPLLPALRLMLQIHQDHRAAIRRLDGLRQRIDRRIDQVLADAARWQDAQYQDELTRVSREFQDDIYDHRRLSPLVFDWYFELKRKLQQLDQDDAAARFRNKVQRVQQALAQQSQHNLPH